MVIGSDKKTCNLTNPPPLPPEQTLAYTFKNAQTPFLTNLVAYSKQVVH